MNEPIINPWIFYSLGVLRNVNIVLLICFILLAVGAAVGAAIFIASSEYEREQYIDKGKSFGRVAAIILALCIFVPSEKTVYQILIARQITPGNIEKAGESAEKIVGKIAEKVIEASEKWEAQRINK